MKMPNVAAVLLAGVLAAALVAGCTQAELSAEMQQQESDMKSELITWQNDLETWSANNDRMRREHQGHAPRAGSELEVEMTAHVAKLAEFVGKLQAAQDGDGTLLDRSVIYFGSGMGNGNAHDRNNPPVLLMGGANGQLKGNRHIAVENKEPTANLLLTLAEFAGSDVEKIGHSTGRLSL